MAHESFNNNLPGEEDRQSGWRRRWRSLLLWSLLLLTILAGAAMYFLDVPVRQTLTGISTAAEETMQRHFPDGISRDAAVLFFRGLWSGDRSSPLSLHNSSGTENAADGFLYSIELADGGRIEGRAIEIRPETIVITDESGVVVEIARERVARIKKIRL